MTQFLTKRTVVECPHGGKGSILVSKQDFVAISNRGQNAFVIGDDLRNPRQCGDFLGSPCRVAAHHHNLRAGILAVSWGQSEAAMALGLKPGQRTRLIVLPQALRVIIPPMTSTYLNLTKNSSLAVAIGYPDLVSVANTMINQTGQAVEGITMIMAVYLTISLIISALMNLYNRAVALVER